MNDTPKTPLDLLSAYIAEMPGGAYIGDLWNTEETATVYVEAGASGYQWDLISAVYTPSSEMPPDEDHEPGTVMLTVPLTVAHMLQWYAGEDTFFIDAYTAVPEIKVEGVNRYLDLSTLHIPVDERDGEILGHDGVLGDRREYGFWIWVPDDVTDRQESYEDYPEWLANIQSHARRLGCNWLLFDADARPLNDLPTFPEKDA